MDRRNLVMRDSAITTVVELILPGSMSLASHESQFRQPGQRDVLLPAPGRAFTSDAFTAKLTFISQNQAHSSLKAKLTHLSKLSSDNTKRRTSYSRHGKSG